MANEEHLAKLKEGPDAWNTWVMAQKSGFHADLTDTDFGSVDLAGANLDDANLTSSNLSGANLSSAFLINAFLFDAYLIDVNLRKTDLAGANLRDADLSGANLINANLSSVDLDGAILTGANLTEAVLTRATLTDTNLTHANLTNTVFNKVNLSNTNLSNAKGLTEINHHGPSTVDHRTIQKTEPPLPDAFLRGCGVPDILIDYYPTLLNQPIQFYSCFISYSHENNDFATRLYDKLQGEGIRCWKDDHKILPGDPVADSIDRGIRVYDKVMLCASKQSLTSGWVESEIDKALDKERLLRKARKSKKGDHYKVWSLIPLDLDGYLFNDDWNRGFKSELTKRNAADFVGWDSDEEKFNRSYEQVKKALNLHRPPEPKSNL